MLKRPIFLFLALSLITVLGFQNCSQDILKGSSKTVSSDFGTTNGNQFDNSGSVKGGDCILTVTPDESSADFWWLRLQPKFLFPSKARITWHGTDQNHEIVPSEPASVDVSGYTWGFSFPEGIHTRYAVVRDGDRVLCTSNVVSLEVLPR